VTPRGRKTRALLAYLISDAGTKVAKSRLSALLWGDREDSHARASLRQALLELRRALNRSHDVISSDLDHIWISSEHFAEDAPELAGGDKDAFEDLDHITPEFDVWLTEERSRRSAARVAALKSEAENLLARGLDEESFVPIERMRGIDAHNEDALRLGMEAEFRQGRPAGIAKRFDEVAAFLKDELGVEPSIDSRVLRDRLLKKITPLRRASDSKLIGLYEAAERMLRMGAWECDLISGQLYWTPGTFLLFGIPPGSTVRLDEITAQYEPRSRQLLEEARGEAIRHGSNFSIEVDISTRDGSSSRLRINAAVERKNGISMRMFGTKQLVS